MKKFLAILVIITLFCMPFDGNAIPEFRTDVQIIDQETIRQSGIMRLGEIFLLIDNWDISTIDGVTWSANPSGSSSFQSQDWTVAIDGNPIDINLFGSKALDRIPVDLSQIVLIRVISRPGIYNGLISDAGLIEIVTQKPDTGLSARVRSALGNETGDPGPYYNTDFSSPNIDKVGTIFAINLSNSKDSLDFALGCKNEVAYPTDEAMLERNVDITGDKYPRQELRSFSVGYGQSHNNFSYRLFAGYSDFHDFFFLRQFGREIPAGSLLKYFNLSGIAGEKRGLSLRYRFAYSSNQLDKMENSLDLDFDWKQEIARANIETAFSEEEFNGSFGFGLDHSSVSTNYLLKKNYIDIGRLYGQLNYYWSQKDFFRFELAFSKYKNEFGAFMSGILYFQLENRTRLKASLTYSKKLPEDIGDFWYWSEQGYNLIKENGFDYVIDGRIKPSKSIAADLALSRTIGDSSFVDFCIFHHSLAHLTSELPFILTAAEYSQSKNLYVYTDGAIRTTGGVISAVISPVEKLRLEMNYRFQAVINDKSEDVRIFSDGPKHIISASIYFSPVRNVSLWGRMSFRSSILWTDYGVADLGPETPGFIRTDETVTLDMTVQKYFQKRKIRASLSIRNLFNEKLQYYPIGARFDLSYFAQLELMIN